VRAILVTFAVEEGLHPALGAAPYGVLSRQLPRLLVSRLNGGSDSGIRFFPFLGKQDGRRCFLKLTSMLPRETIRALLGKTPIPPLLVDGLIKADSLRLRLWNTATGREEFHEDLAFDPRAPKPALRRALFEITGALGWEGGMPSLPDLEGEALAWFLCAHDDLLALEADLHSGDGEPLAAVRKAFALAPGDPALRGLLIESCVKLLDKGRSPHLVAEALCGSLGHGSDWDAGFLVRAGAVLEGCRRPDDACTLYMQAAKLQPGHRAATARAAHLHFASGRYSEARTVLEDGLGVGDRPLTLVAQLAAVEECLGNLTARDRLFEELMGARELPPRVARVVAGYLLGQNRYGEARRVAERALESNPRHAALLLERARAVLLLGDGHAAQDDLARCLEADPSPRLRVEARKLMRLTSRPGALAEMMSIEQALERGEEVQALRRCRRLVAENRSLGEAWLLLGSLHQRLDNSRRAERALSRALALEPRLGEAHDRLGILLVSRGRYRSGYSHLIRAVGELSEDPAPRIHLAQACHFLGLREEGRGYLDEALRLGGDVELVARVRERFFG
jgi:tetratricopeptide (TPR) repeat protein